MLKKNKKKIVIASVILSVLLILVIGYVFLYPHKIDEINCGDWVTIDTGLIGAIHFQNKITNEEVVCPVVSPEFVTDKCEALVGCLIVYNPT